MYRYLTGHHKEKRKSHKWCHQLPIQMPRFPLHKVSDHGHHRFWPCLPCGWRLGQAPKCSGKVWKRWKIWKKCWGKPRKFIETWQNHGTWCLSHCKLLNSGYWMMCLAVFGLSPVTALRRETCACSKSIGSSLPISKRTCRACQVHESLQWRICDLVTADKEKLLDNLKLQPSSAKGTLCEYVFCFLWHALSPQVAPSMFPERTIPTSHSHHSTHHSITIPPISTEYHWITIAVGWITMKPPWNHLIPILAFNPQALAKVGASPEGSSCAKGPRAAQTPPRWTSAQPKALHETKAKCNGKVASLLVQKIWQLQFLHSSKIILSQWMERCPGI